MLCSDPFYTAVVVEWLERKVENKPHQFSGLAGKILSTGETVVLGTAHRTDCVKLQCLIATKTTVST